MFHIVNAIVAMYSNSKYVSHIIAKLEDQDYDTLMALGRGIEFKVHSINALCYHLPNGVMVALRTD